MNELMVISVALVVGMGGIVLWLLRRKRHVARPTPSGHAPDTTETFLDRPASFSLLIFTGDHAAALDELLSKCQYKIMEKRSVEGMPTDIYADLPEPSGPDNAIVCKASYSAEGHTVLLDPEMVLVSHKDELLQFCSEHRTRAICAIWERVSETVAFVEVSEKGVVRDAWYLNGGATETCLNPPAGLVESSDSTGLLNSLSQTGIPASVLNSHVTATQYKLRE